MRESLRLHMLGLMFERFFGVSLNELGLFAVLSAMLPHARRSAAAASGNPDTAEEPALDGDSHGRPHSIFIEDGPCFISLSTESLHRSKGHSFGKFCSLHMPFSITRSCHQVFT